MFIRSLVEVSYDSGKKITYKYDAGGNITSVESFRQITKIKLDKERYEVDEGKRIKIIVSAEYSDGSVQVIEDNFKCESSNPDIAKVDENGVVTGVKQGETNIIVSLGEMKLVANIKVKKTLAVPQNIKSEVSENFIKLSWDKVNYANGYEVEIDGVTKSTSNSSYNFTNLQSNTKHLFRVRALKADISSEWSPLIEVYTNISKPNILKIDSTNIIQRIYWNRIDNITGYDLEVDGILISGITENFYISQNLLPGTNHIYKLRAKNINTNNYSNWVVTSKYTMLNTPQRLSLEASNNAIKLSWDKVNGATRYYILVDGNQKYQSGKNTIFTQNFLKSNSKHTYKVMAYNADTNSEWSSELIGYTLLKTPVIRVEKSTKTSITISWEAVDGATQYEVLADGNLINCTRTKYVQEGLVENTTHIYKIRAKNETNIGEWSKNIRIKTKKK